MVKLGLASAPGSCGRTSEGAPDVHGGSAPLRRAQRSCSRSTTCGADGLWLPPLVVATMYQLVVLTALVNVLLYPALFAFGGGVAAETAPGWFALLDLQVGLSRTAVSATEAPHILANLVWSGRTAAQRDNAAEPGPAGEPRGRGAAGHGGLRGPGPRGAAARDAVCRPRMY